jgi:hypothetical protein
VIYTICWRDVSLSPPRRIQLTDPAHTHRGEITDQAHYCIFCHERRRTPVRGGFTREDEQVQVNPLGMSLQGCPLDETIGEMNILRAGGEAVAGLAIVMIDNPMCPGTGHRICNDCMRSCIFQKQDPVDIPQIEDRSSSPTCLLPAVGLRDLSRCSTRWNPLNVRQAGGAPLQRQERARRGLGPAATPLAHYLANEGFGVVAIDGLKIEADRRALVSGTRFGALPEPVGQTSTPGSSPAFGGCPSTAHRPLGQELLKLMPHRARA